MKLQDMILEVAVSKPDLILNATREAMRNKFLQINKATNSPLKKLELTEQFESTLNKIQSTIDFMEEAIVFSKGGNNAINDRKSTTKRKRRNS